LRRVREDAPAAVRARLIAETRRWAMRDLRGRTVRGLTRVLQRFDEPRIEKWAAAGWEAFTLQALWRVCCDGLAAVSESATTGLQRQPRHRDLLLQVAGVDADLAVHDVLIRFCAAFLDQGLGHWPLPQRGAGFYHAFCSLYRQPGGPPDRWMRGR